MSTLSYAVADSATMLRRNARHVVRYPIVVLMSVGIPVLLLLLFVGVFRELGASLAAGDDYIDYIVPGILLIAICYGSSSTSMEVNSDSTKGIITRFRTMAIARSAVLTGHVLTALIRTAISLVLVVGVALLMGFRPTSDPVAWLAAAGLLMLLTLALTWLAVAVGLAAPNAEGTAGFGLIVQLLPFISSAFTPPATMSGGAQWFAENQPFTPVIDTVRGLVVGGPIGNDGIIAVGWCVGLSLIGYLWARSQFRRAPVH
ncbi:ABC transporter permease [Cryptosporangium aurantiacum]|uniref:Transport permease protein n=1 Tax=Cryptosporangium aurantiacum TaxID=134849 RepID=A0A1M7TX56_9ACTN|nr:ABC transporter permease [Cryptosporangium aurantiacum]SHN75290.1 ABC-2 type transport system permease protein [Cryptosporangium aurantiacum]